MRHNKLFWVLLVAFAISGCSLGGSSGSLEDTGSSGGAKPSSGSSSSGDRKPVAWSKFEVRLELPGQETLGVKGKGGTAARILAIGLADHSVELVHAVSCGNESGVVRDLIELDRQLVKVVGDYKWHFFEIDSVTWTEIDSGDPSRVPGFFFETPEGRCLGVKPNSLIEGGNSWKAPSPYAVGIDPRTGGAQIAICKRV